MSPAKKILGTYFILSGVYGLYLSCSHMIATWDNPQFLWVGIVFTILFSLIIVSGYSILKYGKYSWLTISLQILQVLGFSLFGYKYQFTAGIGVKLMFDATDISFKLQPIVADFFLGKNMKLEFMYVNFIPMVIILMLRKKLVFMKKVV